MDTFIFYMKVEKLGRKFYLFIYIYENDFH